MAVGGVVSVPLAGDVFVASKLTTTVVVVGVVVVVVVVGGPVGVGVTTTAPWAVIVAELATGCPAISTVGITTVL